MEYLTCADTAKLVRNALKQKFPGVKFSVTSKTYTGGASIRVNWTDGPTVKNVEAVAKQFEGADFDGMQDLKTYNHSCHPETGEIVHYGSDWVFCNRYFSEKFTRPAVEEFCRKIGSEVPEYRNGYWNTYGSTFPREFEPSFRAMVEALEEVAPIPEPEPEGTAPNMPAPYSVEYERNWTWLRFAEKPSETVRDALKQRGARWSGKRSAWYITEHVDILTIASIVA